jgi:hypothetical protein
MGRHDRLYPELFFCDARSFCDGRLRLSEPLVYVATCPPNFVMCELLNESIPHIRDGVRLATSLVFGPVDQIVVEATVDSNPVKLASIELQASGDVVVLGRVIISSEIEGNEFLFSSDNKGCRGRPEESGSTLQVAECRGRMVREGGNVMESLALCPHTRVVGGAVDICNCRAVDGPIQARTFDATGSMQLPDYRAGSRCSCPKRRVCAGHRQPERRTILSTTRRRGDAD